MFIPLGPIRAIVKTAQAYHEIRSNRTPEQNAQHDAEAQARFNKAVAKTSTLTDEQLGYIVLAVIVVVIVLIIL